jgi:hypothetical protein
MREASWRNFCGLPKFSTYMRITRHAAGVRRAAVESQLVLTVGTAAGWPVTVLIGPLGITSQRMSREHNAQLVVLGQRNQVVRGCLSSGSGALRIIVRSTIPVYVAAPNVLSVPRCTVIAVDFGGASIRSAHIAAVVIAALHPVRSALWKSTDARVHLQIADPSESLYSSRSLSFTAS